jgi:hypothetical protein
MTDSEVKVSLPKDLFDALEAKREGLGFAKVDDLVAYTLRVWLDKAPTEGKLTDEESKRVEENLKALGYM